MNIKLDFKSILIILLLSLTIIFGLMWFFKKDSGSKNRINQLEVRLEQLEKEKKKIDGEILVWKNRFDSLGIANKKLEEYLYIQSEKTRLAELKANNTIQSLNKMKDMLEKSRKKIEDLKNNPPNRTGDDLLESIKNKTK